MDYIIARKIHPLIDQMELREHHGGKCGGDPGTAPRLFDVLIDCSDGKVATSAEPLPDSFKMLK